MRYFFEFQCVKLPVYSKICKNDDFGSFNRLHIKKLKMRIIKSKKSEKNLKNVEKYQNKYKIKDIGIKTPSLTVD